MNRDTFSYFSEIRTQYLQLHAVLGNSQYDRLALARKLPGSNQLTCFLLRGNFKYSSKPPNPLNYPLSEGSLSVSSDKVYISAIPQTYDSGFLSEDVEFFILNPITAEAQVIGGQKARYIHLERENSLSWVLGVQRFFDESPFQPMEYRIF